MDLFFVLLPKTGERVGSRWNNDADCSLLVISKGTNNDYNGNDNELIIYH
jgi:hypothetical protein